MQPNPQLISLELLPRARFDIFDISDKASEFLNGTRNQYRKSAYSSHHTTAGFLEQSICSRLRYNKERISSYISAFKHLFPVNADYRHDQMELRSELTESERKVEPRNADSHLTFIGSGLKNYVTYMNDPEIPVFFIDLDGVHEFGQRSRTASAMFYNKEERVFRHSLEVPVSRHHIDSVNLRDPRLGYLEKLNELLDKFEVEQGRIDISLDASDRTAGLTVNEYETLLMTHDLVEVLKNPRKFMGEKSRYILQNIHKLPSRTKEYAKYDFVQIFNKLMDAFQLSESVVEKVLARFIALPAERFLQVKKNVSFLVSNRENSRSAEILQGRYQSPILVQWKRSPNQTHRLTLTITRFI